MEVLNKRLLVGTPSLFFTFENILNIHDFIYTYKQIYNFNFNISPLQFTSLLVANRICNLQNDFVPWFFTCMFASMIDFYFQYRNFTWKWKI